ncbi:M16 family metallopeptidase [Propionibacteriaceae bacterium Y1700]|uniref:M16 family metallopeptidase n=1 Tax=Microlunatus sp. Y1700 TaxID=3418487 RepID=UPI003DA738B4
MLPSGLRIVTENMAGSATYSMGVFAGVGSRHESDTLHGASHFLEHVLFKGTPTRSAEEISAAIEHRGGDLNAYTAKEHTCFHVKCLAEDAPLAVDVISDMMINSLIATDDLEAEREVILDEIAMHLDDPDDLAHDQLARGIFSDGQLGRTVIGSPESVAAMSRRQVMGHWRRHYRPSRVVIAAAGHVDHDQLCEMLSGWEGDPTPAPTVRPQRLAAPQQQVLTVNRPTGQTAAVLGFAGCGLFDDRRHALALLSTVIGGGMSSRLFVEVRERRGLAYGIDAMETTYSDAGLWAVDWHCSPSRVPEILGLVRQCLAEVSEHGVTSAELERAKSQLRGQTLLAFEGPTARMSRLGSAELAGDPRTVSQMLDQMEQVSVDDCRRVAAEVFGSTPVLSLVGPRIGTKRLGRTLANWA